MEMSFRIGKYYIVQPERHEPCAECGKTKELRPWGENGARICFDCAQRTRESRARCARAMRDEKKGIAGAALVVQDMFCVISPNATEREVEKIIKRQANA